VTATTRSTTTCSTSTTTAEERSRSPARRVCRADAIAADKISIDGRCCASATFRPPRCSRSKPTSILLLTSGLLIAVSGYNDAPIRAGTAYGSEASGYRQATDAEFAFPDAFVLSNGAGATATRARAGPTRRRSASRSPPPSRARCSRKPIG
jgi:hypothetical protein